VEIEGPHQHHPHGTGTRWLDITLAVCAFVISVVSLYLSIHSAHTMEKLVTASSYPNVDINFSNSDNVDNVSGGLPRKAIRFELESTGVGPARIEWVSMSYKGKPVASVSELLAACCDDVKKTDASGMLRSSGVGDLLPPGKIKHTIYWKEPAEENALWSSLHKAMFDVSMETCYCSVFDECFIRSKDVPRPKPVKVCVPPKVAFNPSL
jgi:hypothetical protein